MTDLQRRTLRALIAAVLAGGLSGCGSVNERLSAGVADTLPQWAGGLPSDAPPRPGTPEYDAFMRERERRRQLPAAERDALARGDIRSTAPAQQGDGTR